MKLEETQLNCQIPCLQNVAVGSAKAPASSLIRQAKLKVRRRMSPGKERVVKNYTNNWINRFCQLTGKSTKPTVSLKKSIPDGLQTNDWVRVRPLKEIQATLNHWNQVKGCAFMPEMAKYCGAKHRVLKNMKRFVDERDLLIKKSSGIILLEGVMCQGTTEFGSCDRGCFHFWREEWLEKISEPANPLPIIYEKINKTGEWVRVRSLNEIEATFKYGNQVEGCAFMPEMAKYCGTKHRVLKHMKRFVDERDLKVKEANDIVLLDGVMCHGMAEFGSCDRSCFYLWKKEWIEEV